MFLPFLFSAALAQATSTSCALTDRQTQLYLAMSFQDFDQRMDGGWRVEFNRHCPVHAAQLIDHYRVTNRNSLSDDEIRILYWHAAQLYGMFGRLNFALPRFRKSFDPKESVDSPLRWNSYVRGTIAYFEFNFPALKSARDDVAGESASSQNLAILDGMIRCFDLPRTEAYSGKCRASL